MAQKVLERPPPGLEKAMEKISPTEELCIEHAMLDRIMLAMDQTLKMAGSRKADLSPLKQACAMIRQVVDEHHMKIEEEEVYPKFEDDRVLAPMIEDFEEQHDEARKMVDRLEELAEAGKPDTAELRRVFMDFRDMMMAHAAREETVLFPAMQGTWSDDELDALKEAQEEDEKKLLGDDADEKVFKMLGDIEAAAGIESVGDFTRRLK
jgi:hemerythrin-like domain-containing protein